MTPENENSSIAVKRLNPDEVSKILQLWEEQQNIRNNPTLADVAETLGISIEDANELYAQTKPKEFAKSENETKKAIANNGEGLIFLLFLFPLIGAIASILLAGFLIILLFTYKMAGLAGLLTLGVGIAAIAFLYGKYNRRKRGNVLTIQGRK